MKGGGGYIVQKIREKGGYLKIFLRRKILMRKLVYLIVVLVSLGLIVAGCIPTVPPTGQGELGTLTKGQALVTVRVTTGEGDPLANVTIAKKFSEAGSTSYFPANSPRVNTDENGEISALFDVGTTLYLQARVNGTNSEWQSQTVEVGGNLYEFSTTTVYATITESYRVSFGGPTGQARWLTDITRHIFPGTYVFHFNGLGRINLPVSGSVMNLGENGIEYEWRPPVYDGMVITNKNATTPFKFKVVIAGYPIIMDNYYDEELVSLKIAGISMEDLEYDEEKAEFKAHFKVRDYLPLADASYYAEVFYDNDGRVPTLNFFIDVDK